MLAYRRTLLRLAALTALSALTLAPDVARAQENYPSRPIRIIVPFSGGSGSDATARYYAQKMTPMLGQQIIVENKPGADGILGMQAAKAAPADGYTIVQGGISPSVVNAVAYENLPYDPVKDFKPLLGYGRNMNVLVVSSTSPFKSFADLLKHGKSASVPLNVGTFSTTLQLATAWLGEMSGARFASIPYKGQSNALTDLMGNQLDLALVDLGGATPLIRAGKLRALAVTGEKRSADFPDVPTVQEHGMPGYVLYSWNAFYIRAETPPAIQARLAEAIQKVMVDPETINNFYKPKGTEGIPLSSEQMQKLQREEIERFRKMAASMTFTPR